jgi:hypothetical protein
MADNTHLYGFRWHSSKAGGSMPKPVELYYATGQNDVDDGTNSIQISVGDPLKLMNTGGVKVALSNEDVSFVAVGFAPVYNATSGVIEPSNRVPNATAWGTNEDRRVKILGVPVRGQIFECDCDDAVTATTFAAYVAFINENCTWKVAGAGTPRKADPMIDIEYHATTAALGLRLVGISGTAYNRDFSGNYVKLLVEFNEINDANAPANASVIVGV